MTKPNMAKIGQIRVFWGPRRPSGGLLFTKSLNVKLLLFIDPIVVLLLLFNASTLFSA